jgi:cation:H+ antiporter
MTLTTVLLTIAGLGLLVAGGELLVRGASGIAAAAGVSRLVIGLTIVSVGTSAPEMLVSVYASLTGNPDIAVANVVGSNIFNVLLILGACAVLRPLVVASRLIRIDVPVMVAVSFLLLALARDGTIGRWDGLLLLGGAMAYAVVLLRQGRRDEVLRREAPGLAGPAQPPARAWAKNGMLVAIGLGLLILGARWLVDGAASMARALGVSDVIIGLTIIAAGTSLPEVATSVMATLRGERDIAIGNVIGSNIFNILGILGLSGLVATPPLAVHASVVDFDLPVMVAVAATCLPLFFTGNDLRRWEGAVFLTYYGAYLAYMVMASSQHDALPVFSRTMILFVVPITLLTVTVAATREWRRERAD